MDQIQAIQQVIETALAEANTAEPARIVSYNPATNRAIVRASMPKRMADGSVLDAPQIYEVPVVWPVSSGGGAGGAILSFPVKPGDGVMLIYQQRSLDGWSSGNDAAPDDPRHHDISDAVAIPGLSASGVSPNPTDVELRFGQSRMVIQPDASVHVETPGGTVDLTTTEAVMRVGATTVHIVGGAIKLTTAGGTLTIGADGSATYSGGTLTTDSNIVTSGDVIAGTISLRNHIHSGVQGGASNSGAPVP
jgi:hypothetical protein